MTSKEKAELKVKMQEELHKLNINILELKKLCEPISPECALGDLTRFELIHDQEVSQKTLIQTEQRSKDLHYALSKINKDTFGLCVQCDEEIVFARLLLMPEAKLCMSCASNL